MTQTWVRDPDLLWVSRVLNAVTDLVGSGESSARTAAVYIWWQARTVPASDGSSGRMRIGAYPTALTGISTHR
jgi:hypothetical protein